jgi:hypothetical protein
MHNAGGELPSLILKMQSIKDSAFYSKLLPGIFSLV